VLSNKLSTLLVSGHNESWITDDGITLAALKDDVSKAIESIKSVPNEEVALFHSDAYIFLVWLLAAWQEKRKVLVPVDKSIALSPRFSNWFKIGEFDAPNLANWDDSFELPNRVFSKLDPNFEALGVFTSGSTGEPVKIDKTIQQLENEVEALEFTFGEKISKTVVFYRSVSHQHFFGMPFGVYWAVSRGSKLSRFVIKGGHEWNTLNPQVLITSPPFLKSIAHTASQHKNIGSGIQSIFSAGGMLEDSIFSTITKVTKTRVIDIYGSSETGHIAWRNSPEMPWQIQAGVEFKKPINDVLEIRSKFCPSDAWFATSDLARQNGESFEILGRADQIIKIEGTRVSLSQLVTSIKESSFVDDCLISDLENGRRSQLGAVLKLSSLGLDALEVDGRLKLINGIKESLRGKVISVAVPRRWRFVAEFPKNNLGKVLKTDLDGLFLDGLKTPIVIGYKAHDNSAELTLDILKSLACFNGHFDDFPVIPGVALIEWAMRAAESHLLKEHIFIGMSQIKFQKFIRPNQVIRLSLDFNPESMNLKYKYHSAGIIYSSGILKFRVK
jgi:acyl-CoA synthetase (AMP-forming)/AMP-acid ligase II/3-hydroxymyristoyl/3-hydroxydecanoyl-(acyl carrier protein) dehydratase